MITKKDIKAYDFKNIENYFEYIVESHINGQKNQAKELVKKLSKKQKQAAKDYIYNNFKDLKGELLQYFELYGFIGSYK